MSRSTFLLSALALSLLACGDDVDPEVVVETSSLQFNDVRFLAGTFIALGTSEPDGAVIATSTDGQRWDIEHADRQDRFLTGVARGNGISIATGNEFASVDGTTRAIPFMLASSDGGPWTEIAVPDGLRVRDIAFGLGQFVVTAETSDDAQTLVSADGETWTATSHGKLWWSPRVNFVGDRFVVYGEGSGVAESTDGTTWTYADLGVTVTHQITSLGGEIIGAGTYDCCFGEVPGAAMAIAIGRSASGWNARAEDEAPSILSLASSDDQTFAVAYDGIYEATDLAVWSFAPAFEFDDEFGRIGEIAAGNGVFVVAARDLLVSTGDAGWSAVDLAR